MNELGFTQSLAKPTLLRHVLSQYAEKRHLSDQQLRIFWLHLVGESDKSIAAQLGCKPTTVYAHWQRMAKKAQSRYKSGVVGDFHRFLDDIYQADVSVADRQHEGG